MRTLNISNLVVAALAVTILSHAQPLYAQASKQNPVQNQTVGGVGTGGGDPCEKVIGAIRKDFLHWIEIKGYETLELPPDFDYKKYADEMKKSLEKVTKVECITKDHKEFPITVPDENGRPVAKACKFIKDGENHRVLCEYEKLINQTPVDEQYSTYHHEHASLIGLEPPNASESSYDVSSQISAYRNQVLQLTAVRRSKNLRMYRVQPNAIFYALNGREVRLRTGTIFKGRESKYDDKPSVKVEQMFDGYEWVPIEKSLEVMNWQVENLEKQSVRLPKQELTLSEPSERSQRNSDSIIPAGTKVSGWVVNNSNGMGPYLFVDEYYDTAGKLWQPLPNPGFFSVEIGLGSGYIMVPRPE